MKYLGLTVVLFHEVPSPRVHWNWNWNSESLEYETAVLDERSRFIKDHAVDKWSAICQTYYEWCTISVHYSVAFINLCNQ